MVEENVDQTQGKFTGFCKKKKLSIGIEDETLYNVDENWWAKDASVRTCGQKLIVARSADCFCASPSISYHSFEEVR